MSQAIAEQPIIKGEWLSERGLSLPPGLPFERWLAVGEQLKRLERGVQFWLGDWINYGEREYGEKYVQAIEETNLSHGTLRNYASVAGRIEMSRRNDNLSFSHFSAVAPLPREEQDEWLERAVQEEMPVAEFRARIKNKVPTGPMIHIPKAQLDDLKELARHADVAAQEGYSRKWDDPL